MRLFTRIAKAGGYNPYRGADGQFTSGAGGGKDRAQAKRESGPGERKLNAKLKRDHSGSGAGASAPNTLRAAMQRMNDEEKTLTQDMHSTDFKLQMERPVNGERIPLPRKFAARIKANKLKDVGEDIMELDSEEAFGVYEGHNVIATVNGREYLLADGWEFLPQAPKPSSSGKRRGR